MALFSQCSYQKSQGEIKLIRDKDRWSGIFIPSGLIEDLDNSNPGNDINVRVSGKQENILGEFSSDSDGILFTPIVRLTSGTTYEVLYKGNSISRLTVAAPSDTGAKASLQSFYPSADTLPENLLKVYLTFSKPMRRGVSERYLAMLDANGDTLHDIFLNLNTELWNEDGRQLTIWLNPGRIKRGLQPNEREGNPLQAGNSYTLAISPEWSDLSGRKLDKRYSKTFVTTAKDTKSPDPATWRMNSPASGSRQALKVTFNEPLDHTLLYNTVSIIRGNEQAVKGQILVNDQERSLLFQPENQWMAGTYFLKIDSRLEDLAGNNLNRLFDRDMLKDKPASDNEFHKRQFVIR